MIRLQTLAISGAALSFIAGAGLAATPENSKYYGSIYPEDTVAPVNPPANSTTAQRGASAGTRLESAMGPAGYLVSGNRVGADFVAAVRRAVGRHPAFHAQASDLGESQAQRRRARSALYPQISGQLTGDYSIQRDFSDGTDNVVESLRPRERFTAGVSASQLVFDGGATLQRIRSARALDEEYKNALSTRINDLAIQALTAYYDVAAHQALNAFGEAYIRRHEQILEDVKERERLGAGSKADVTRAFARLAAARARLSEVSESKRIADIRYEEFFGERPGTLHRPFIAGPDIDSRNETVAVALDSNPEIAAAQARADARQADFKAAKGARYPEVRVTVDAVKYDVFDGGEDFDVRAGVNLNYSIFGGGARSADIAIARSRAQKERFNSERVRQDVAREAAMAFERLEGADERLVTLGDAVIAHDETRHLVLERYRLSRGDLIDVLQAENDYFEAGVSFVIALTGRDMAEFALMEQTGDLLREFSPENEYEEALYGAANE
jgi:adhesin transport system outer membrane protein